MGRVVSFEDDVTGDAIDKDLVGGDPIYSFTLDGEEHAIYAGVKTRDALKKFLQKYIDASNESTAKQDLLDRPDPFGRRNPARAPLKGPKSQAPSAPKSDPEQLAAIREWARKQEQFKDRKISDRGRVSGDIKDAFHAANGA